MNDKLIIKYFTSWGSTIELVNEAVQIFVNDKLSEGYELIRHEVMMTESSKILVVLELSKEDAFPL